MRGVGCSHRLRFDVDHDDMPSLRSQSQRLPIGRLTVSLLELELQGGLTNCRSIPNFPFPVSITFPVPPNTPRPTALVADASPFSPSETASVSIDRIATLDDLPDHAQHFCSGCKAPENAGSSTIISPRHLALYSIKLTRFPLSSLLSPCLYSSDHSAFYCIDESHRSV